ncbi:MAG: hypothetical protein HY881_22695 [Deltaproteobacteria bacterium]|nr:hypothetical protein [Deltaproteobacteria bacterium]
MFNMQTCYSLFMLLSSLFIAGCSTTVPHNVNEHFYDYQHITNELHALTEKNAPFVETYVLDYTHEGRAIMAIKIGKRANPIQTKPGVLAIFAEHAGEHDTTSLAMGIMQYLIDHYSTDENVSRILEKTELWIIPMMNPDGVDYDLSGAGEPFSWRKNRRRTGEATYGVDLNRNWEYHFETESLPEMPKNYSQKDNPNYAGDKPFSERETRAVRDFLLAHKNIRILLDYHSGGAGFMQGAVGCFNGRGSRKGTHPSVDTFCNNVIDGFAEAISDPDDGRPDFLLTNREDAASILRQRVPFYLRPFVPSTFFQEPGTAVNYVYDQLNIAAICIEMFRDRSFFKKLPDSQNKLTKNQIRGFLRLLTVQTTNEDVGFR